MAINATYPAPVQLGVTPPTSEGSKSVGVSILWQTVFTDTGGFVTPINLLSQFQSGQFTTIQAVYCDNQTCPEMVTLVCNETGFTLRVPPFAKGMYPVLCGPAPSFTATLNLCFDPMYGQAYSKTTTRFWFLNTPQTPFESLPSSFGQNFSSYMNNMGFNGLVPTPPILIPGISGGSGLAALGNNQIYAINSIQYTLTNLTPYGFATPVGFGIFERDETTAFIRWQKNGFVTATSTGVITSGISNFLTPILQLNPLNNLYAFVNAGEQAPGPGATQFQLMMTYSVLTVA